MDCGAASVSFHTENDKYCILEKNRWRGGLTSDMAEV